MSPFKTPAVSVRHPAPWRMALACLIGVATAGPAAAAERVVRIQGSSTFNERLVEPNEAAIAARAKVKLDIVSSKSVWGLMALLEGRADMAMISGDLKGETAAVRELAPKLPVDTLLSHEIARVRTAFAVHPDNPVRHLGRAEMRAILKGEITNWKVLGGADRPIRLVAVREGGGTVVAVRHQILDGAALAAPDMIRLESPRHVLKIVAQEPGAIGIAQYGLLQATGIPEIEIDQPVEQSLSFVTLGRPSEAAGAVIEAMRAIAGAAPM